MPATAPKLDAYGSVRLFHKMVECSYGQETDVVLNMIQEKQIPVAALKKLNEFRLNWPYHSSKFKRSLWNAI